MNRNILIITVLAVVHVIYGHGSFAIGGDPGLSGILHPSPYITTSTRHGIVSGASSHHQFVDVNGLVHGNVGLNGIDGGYIGGLAGLNRIAHTDNIGVNGLVHNSLGSSGIVNVNGVVHSVGEGLDVSGGLIHQAGIPLRSHVNGHIVHQLRGVHHLVDDGSYVHDPSGDHSSYLRQHLVNDGSYVHDPSGDHSSYLRQHLVNDGSYVHDPSGDDSSYVRQHLVNDGSFVNQQHQITAHGPVATSSSSSIVNLVPNTQTLIGTGGFIRNDLGLVNGGHTIQTVSSPGIVHQSLVHESGSDIVTSHIQENGGNVVQHINSANENHQFSLPAAGVAHQFLTTNGGIISNGGVISHGLVGDAGIIGHGLVGEGGVISHGLIGGNGIRVIGNTGAVSGIINHQGLVGGGKVLLTSPQLSGISVQHHVTGDLTQSQLESLRLPTFQTNLLNHNLEGQLLVNRGGFGGIGVAGVGVGGIFRGVGSVVNGNLNFVQQPTATIVRQPIVNTVNTVGLVQPTVHQTVDLVQPTVVRGSGGVVGGVGSTDQVVSVNFQENGENTEHRIDSVNEHFKFTVPTVTNDDSSSPISGGTSFGGVVGGGSVEGSFTGDLNTNVDSQLPANNNNLPQSTVFKGFSRYGVPNVQ